MAKIPRIRFSHVGIHVHDIDVMVDFYTNLLGLSLTVVVLALLYESAREQMFNRLKKEKTIWLLLLSEEVFIFWMIFHY